MVFSLNGALRRGNCLLQKQPPHFILDTRMKTLCPAQMKIKEKVEDVPSMPLGMI
jgi:hypothetical protein